MIIAGPYGALPLSRIMPSVRPTQLVYDTSRGATVDPDVLLAQAIDIIVQARADGRTEREAVELVRRRLPQVSDAIILNAQQQASAARPPALPPMTLPPVAPRPVTSTPPPELVPEQVPAAAPPELVLPPMTSPLPHPPAPAEQEEAAVIVEEPLFPSPAPTSTSTGRYILFGLAGLGAIGAVYWLIRRR